MPMAGPVVMKGPVQGWMDEKAAGAAGRSDFLSKLNNAALTLRQILDESLGYVWNPSGNINVTIVAAELNMVQGFWFPAAQPETKLRSALKNAVTAAVESDLPLDCWWECTSLIPNTREVYIRMLPQKVHVLFYSDLPLGHPAVSAFMQAQPDTLSELSPTKASLQRYVIGSGDGVMA